MKAQKTFESPEPTLYDVIETMKVGFERIDTRFDSLKIDVYASINGLRQEIAEFRLENRLEHQEMNQRLARLEIQNEDKTYRIENHEGRLKNIEVWSKGKGHTGLAGA